MGLAVVHGIVKSHRGEMVRQILEIRPSTPIIVCTGLSEVFSPQRARSTGIRRVLMKPLSMESIAHAVRDVLEPQ